MPVTSEQMDELIRQMKIANRIQIADLMREFKVNPIKCRTDEEVEHWNDLIDSVSNLTQYLDI